VHPALPVSVGALIEKNSEFARLHGNPDGSLSYNEKDGCLPTQPTGTRPHFRISSWPVIMLAFSAIARCYGE
jgi:hypothetical protein